VQHGVVAQGQGIVIGRRGEKPVHLGDGEHLGQRPARFGQIKNSAGIDGNAFFRQEKLEKSAQRGDPPGIAPAGDALSVAMGQVGAQMAGVNLAQLGKALGTEKIEPACVWPMN